MFKRDFNKMSLEEKAELVFSKGEYINFIHYYGQKVVLFQVDIHYIEIYYSLEDNSVSEISILETPERLHHYTMNIDISGVL